MLLVALLVIIVTLIFLINKFKLTFWTRRGFKQTKPSTLFGDAGSMLTLKQTIGEFFEEIYKNHKQDKIIGIYLSYLPVLLVTDPKYVQDIMIKDFSSFTDRPLPLDEENDPLSAHMFALRGQKW